MSFDINPCKACLEKYERGVCDINSVNSCVAETAAAFAGIPSTNFTRNTAAGSNWNTCMDKMKASLGRTPCDFRLSMAPVWVQAPHYFPELLSKLGNPDSAIEKCMVECDKNSNTSGSCKENCLTDFAAVTKVSPRENYIMQTNIPLKNEAEEDTQEEDTPSKDTPEEDTPSEDPQSDCAKMYKEARNSNPIVFWLSFCLGLLLLSFVILMFYRALVY
jgi:hypothetical protein